MCTLLAPFVASTFERSYIANVLTSMTKFLTAFEVATCFTLLGGVSPLVLDADCDDQPLVLCANTTTGHPSLATQATEFCEHQLKLGWAVMAIFPNWVKMMQSVRGAVDAATPDRRKRGWLNALKYAIAIAVSVISTINAVSGISVLDVLRGNAHPLAYTWLGVAVIATVYKFVWDLLVDWEIGRRHTYSYGRCVYGMAILINGLLRVTWVFTISPSTNFSSATGRFNRRGFLLLCGILEIVRRCVWTFIKVEKDHVRRWGKAVGFDDSDLHSPLIF